MKSDAHPFILANHPKTTSKTLGVYSPYSGEEVSRVCMAGHRDIEEAIEKGLSAFKDLKKLPVYKRAELLHLIAKKIGERKEDFARLIALEAGKPITFARVEVDRCRELFDWAAEEIKRWDGDMIPLELDKLGENRVGIYRRFPIGVVLAITPFNFPLNLVAHKVAPALAVGNPVIVRPSSSTPSAALLLGKIISETDLPPGSISVLPCDTSLGQKMVSDPRIAMFTFTGSPEVGWRLKEIAGRKKTTLELGGNAALIVDSLRFGDFLYSRTILGAYYQAGQVCISIQRIFVQRKLYRDFLEEMKERVESVPTGDPLDEKVICGPLIDKNAADRVEAWINEALRGGAQVVVGGKRLRDFSSIITPCILTHTTPDMKVNSMEVFGPVVTVEPYEDFEEAVAMANDSVYGLQTGIFTDDISRAFYAYNHLDVGGVIINDIPTYRADPMPYGGIKMSGCGKEGIRYAMEEMTEGRLLALKYA